MAGLSIFATAGPYHILAYGTLLGSGIFQSFVGGITAYRALPRSAFSQLQSALFPIYFGMQTALPIIMALTYPAAPHRSLNASSSSGIVDYMMGSLLAPSNRATSLIPIATMFISGIVNLLYCGPETTRVMKERKHQETKDGKKSYDTGPHSPEMQRLNKQFGTMHGISTLVNLGGLFATVWYGGTLASMIAA